MIVNIYFKLKYRDKCCAVAKCNRGQHLILQNIIAVKFSKCAV